MVDMHAARLFPLAALGVAALAGCGGSDGGSTAAPAASTSAPAASTAAAAPAAKASKRVAVAIKDFDYTPKKLSVAKGATVTWTNADPANHTVTFDAGAMKSLGNQRQGSKRSMRFAAAGTFAYHCDFHPNMHGTVVVR
jgi:plastocyanin